jgi:hypothetical protein
MRTRWSRRMHRTSAALVLTLVAGVALGFGLATAAAVVSPFGHVPPPKAAKAKDAAPLRLANTRSTTSGGPWWFISKVTPIAADSTTIASLTLPAGSYQLTATGSMWTTSGKAVQNVGCHMQIGSSSYADAYVSLDASSVTQQAYALTNVLSFKARTTVVVECLLGSNPPDAVSTQVNFVAINS